ncbi:MAG: response regulator [candidate division Zixibacteria bacterium]|nr:response regulator [candidate division Zixibacteria bacterium]
MNNTKPRVLAVDDELLIRDLLYDFFNEKEWDVTVTESAEKALDQMRAREFDILITDLKMPNMDGLTLIEKARNQKPNLPVVVITGYPSVESAVKCLRQKVDDYLVKPFNVTQLYKVVQGALKNAEDKDSA